MCASESSGDDRDPYAWPARLKARAPVVQLQQSDGLADHLRILAGRAGRASAWLTAPSARPGSYAA